MTNISRREPVSASGQSLVEFALVLPIMVLLLVGIFDLARIYTTMLSVESAAREAADYGAFGSANWEPARVTGTEDSMRLRACTAASDLPDYEGPNDNCANPSFSYELSPDKGSPGSWGPWNAADGCDNDTRNPPCWVKVNLEYDFRLLIPLRLEVFGMVIGLPDTLTFERESIYAVSDLKLP